VTGAAGGLGQAIALRLATAGLDLMLSDLGDCQDTVTLAPIGASIEVRQCDLAAPSEVDRLAHQACDAGCTVLVNNAGIFPQIAWNQLEIDNWSRVIQINLNAPFLLARRLGEGMVCAGGGRIVNIVSATIEAGRAGSLAYVTSKMGLVGLTRGLAAALGPHGVTVNAVGPGLMRTPGTESLYGAGANRFGDMAARRAMRRLLEPQDVAALVEFLVREEAGMITGQTIFVDGGEGRS
jgi:NAD(P)-dependent dehydrogenase (short-subunit alcohol dehydrogenase family)